MTFNFYIDNVDSSRDHYIVRIRSGIVSKAELLQCFSENAKFPGYFGMNWDAFEECIFDLSWIRERIILIIHDDIPMHDDTKEIRIYLDILNQASKMWNSNLNNNTIKFLPHEMIVLFPESAKEKVNDLINTDSR